MISLKNKLGGKILIREILKLGNPDLYKKSEEIRKDELDYIRQVVGDLKDTLLNFREEYKCGRAIAAPQIGVFKRLIYMNIDGEETIFINPILKFKGDKKITLLDDCMSFPDLLVKVERYQRTLVEYKDINFKEEKIEFKDDLSELIQHEYDHLDGILATTRAIDEKSFCLKSERKSFEREYL